MGKEISAEEPSTSSLRPSDYSFEIRYIDGNGRPVPGNVVIQFEKAGNYSSEELPLPLGYQKMCIRDRTGFREGSIFEKDFSNGKTWSCLLYTSRCV